MLRPICLFSRTDCAAVTYGLPGAFKQLFPPVKVKHKSVFLGLSLGSKHRHTGIPLSPALNACPALWG